MKYRLFPGGEIALFCLVITRINSTFVIGNDLPGKTGFCFQRFGVVSGSETEIPGAENRIAHDSFCGQPLVAARWKSHKNRGGLWSMPFSQIRYILLAHRSSEKTDTGQRIDTPLNPLPTSKDLQKSFTVGFGKTGAPATAAGEKESDLQTRSTDEGRPRSDAITISGHSAGPNTASKLCQTKTAKSAGMH